MVQQHLEHGRDGVTTPIVDRGQHPCSLGECQMRYPCAVRDERLGNDDLLRIIPGHEPDQHVGVNGPHGVS